MGTDRVADESLDSPDAVRALELGHLELRAQIQTGNNAVFVADVVPASPSTASETGQSGNSGAGKTLRCIYKPIRGERPLWDFPDQPLAPREVAAYAIDRALGWGLVPPTVLRDGPLGPGSCQLWIPHTDVPPLFDVLPASDVSAGWKAIATARVNDDGQEREVVLAHADDERLARLAVFDAVINNSDRKAGHLLVDTGGGLWAIDHGVSFHVEPKLRTVLWGWSGDRLPAETVSALDRLRLALDGELGGRLAEYLNPAEMVALLGRVDGLLSAGDYPAPAPGWPPLPYPLF